MRFYGRRICLIGLFLGAVSLVAGTKSVISLSKVATAPPKIDGKLDDACWKDAARIDTLTKFKATEIFKDAEIKIAYDNRWLYIAFHAKNPSLKHIDRYTVERDKCINNESLEIFLHPGVDEKLYYHLALNAANGRWDQLITKNSKDFSWFLPFRSAVQRNADSWSAEIAIPMYLLTDYGDPAKTTVNFLYNREVVKLDAYGAVDRTFKEYYIWSPVVDGPHEQQSFGRLNGLDGKGVQPPFMPFLERVDVDALKNDGKGFCYEATGKIGYHSKVAGEVLVEILDNVGSRPVERKIARPVGSQGALFNIGVPIENFKTRNVMVRMKDVATGEILDEVTVNEPAALRLTTRPALDRSYYTTETDARLRCRFGLPILSAKYVLKVRDAKGAVLASSDQLRSETILSLPLKDIPLGATKLSVALEQPDGTVVETQSLTLTKLSPRPGYEIKTNTFDLYVLKDGKPFFPFGIDLSHTSLPSNLAYLRAAKAAGMNTVILERVLNEGNPFFDTTKVRRNAIEFIREAAKENMMVLDWASPQPEPVPFKSQEELREICDKFWRANAVNQEQSVLNVREFSNILAYYNVDEPNLCNPEERVNIAEKFFEMARRLDPYRPVFCLYARSIPDIDAALRVSDWIAYDIYVNIGWGDWRSNPANYIAGDLSRLRDIADAAGQVTMCVPQTMTLDVGRCPIPLGPREQRCQTYASLIYGAKGISYFSSINIYAKAMWDEFGCLAKEIYALQPFLLSPPLGQRAVCDGTALDATRLIFPKVHAAIFQDPETRDYALLAVSASEEPLNVRFAIAGLKDAELSPMFGDTNVKKEGDAFVIAMSGYGTAALRIKTAEPLVSPIAIAIATTPGEGANADIPIVNQVIAKTERSRNFMANPVFSKKSAYPEFPNYIRPYGNTVPVLGEPDSDWRLDPENAWNGHPSLMICPREPFGIKRNPKHDWYACSDAGIPNYNAFTVLGAEMMYYPPDLKSTQVFSAYMKGAKEGDRITIHNYLWNKSEIFTLSKEWKRYSFSSSPSPSYVQNCKGISLLFRALPGSQVWINGVQVENGETPTAFTEE